MSWTNPLTWAVGQLVTAAQLNTHLRDNMLETAAAKVTTAGDIVYATAANALARLGVGSTGQVLTVASGLPSWQTHAHTNSSANLGADVTINTANTWFDGPSLSLAAGTWLVIGGATMHQVGAFSATMEARLFDGTSSFGPGTAYNPSTGGAVETSVVCSDIITLGSTTTVKLQVASSSNNALIKATSNQSSTPAVAPATWIKAVRIA